MSILKKINSLRTIKTLVKILTLNKVPDLECSIRILTEHSILLAKQSVAKRQGRKCSVQVLAAKYTVILLKARRYHYPIQYLVGQWPFLNLVLKLKPPILIPRFQTQYLVSQAISQIKKKWVKGSTIKLVDLGCGSGAIGLALIKQLQQDYQISGTLLDINPSAIRLAQQNLIKNNIRPQLVSFTCKDMREAVSVLEQGQVIISNPPYLGKKSHKKLQKQVKLYQSHDALVAARNGLEFIQFIVPIILRQRKHRDLLCFIEYGGEDLTHLGVQQNVQQDQYGKRRFIVFV